MCILTRLGCEVTDGAPQKSTRVLKSRAPLRTCFPTLQLWRPYLASHTSRCSSLPGAPQTWTSPSTSLWKSRYPSRWQGHGHPSRPALFPTPGASVVSFQDHIPIGTLLVCLSFPPAVLLVWGYHLGQVGLSSQAHHFRLPIKLDLHLLFASAWGNGLCLNTRAAVLAASGAQNFSRNARLTPSLNLRGSVAPGRPLPGSVEAQVPSQFVPSPVRTSARVSLIHLETCWAFPDK